MIIYVPMRMIEIEGQIKNIEENVSTLLENSVEESPEI